MPRKIIYGIIFLLGGVSLIFSPCLVKSITGYPCPACGTRRAIISVFHGDLAGSILINPYGIIFLLVILFFICGLIYEWISRSGKFYRLCRRMELKFANRYVLFALFVAMILNWIWNIEKGI